MQRGSVPHRRASRNPPGRRTDARAAATITRWQVETTRRSAQLDDMRTLFQAPVLFGLLVALSGCGGAKPATTLRVSGIPDSKGTEIDALARAVESYLGKELGMPVEYINATNYAAAVAMMGSNKVDLGWFGGVTGVDAVDACRGEARMIATREKDLQFKTYFIANRAVVDAGNQPGDLADLNPSRRPELHAGNLRSTRGTSRGTSWWRLASTPKGRQGGAKNQINHAMTLDMVADGRVDVGALNYTNYSSPATRRSNRRSRSTRRRPTWTTAWSRGTAWARLVNKIQAAFTKLDAEDPNRVVLDAFKAKKFVAVIAVADPRRDEGPTRGQLK